MVLGDGQQPDPYEERGTLMSTEDVDEHPTASADEELWEMMQSHSDRVPGQLKTQGIPLDERRVDNPNTEV